MKKKTGNPKTGNTAPRFSGQPFKQILINPKTGVTFKEELFGKKYIEFLNKGYEMGEAAKKAAAVAYKNSHAVKTKYVYQVMARDRVQKYINKLLDKGGFTDEAIVRDLRMLVTRGLSSDRTSLSDAARGLDMILKLKDRYPATKVQSASVKFNADLMGKSHEQLDKEIKNLEEEEAEFSEILEGEIIDE
ncbi:MAG: hypothetical protein [Podoviridae sp. ctg2L5]|nr:MAG: hypothetical protein [Podoviridae sp. ctg2L5]